MQCRAHVAQLGRMQQEFGKVGVEVLIVLGNSLERAAKYAGQLKLPFPVLADPERTVYRAYDLERVAFVIQRTASVIVDRNGMIRYIKRAINPMEWLRESRELLAFMEGLERET